MLKEAKEVLHDREKKREDKRNLRPYEIRALEKNPRPKSPDPDNLELSDGYDSEYIELHNPQIKEFFEQYSDRGRDHKDLIVKHGHLVVHLIKTLLINPSWYMAFLMKEKNVSDVKFPFLCPFHKRFNFYHQDLKNDLLLKYFGGVCRCYNNGVHEDIDRYDHYGNVNNDWLHKMVSFMVRCMFEETNIGNKIETIANNHKDSTNESK